MRGELNYVSEKVYGIWKELQCQEGGNRLEEGLITCLIKCKDFRRVVVSRE